MAIQLDGHEGTENERQPVTVYQASRTIKLMLTRAEQVEVRNMVGTPQTAIFRVQDYPTRGNAAAILINFDYVEGVDFPASLASEPLVPDTIPAELTA